MNKLLLLSLAALGLAAAGCANLELGSVDTDANRVLTGVVKLRDDTTLPPDAKVVVRVLDASNPAAPPSVLGEQTLTNPGQPPIAFRVEYKANDGEIRHGLNVQARISFGGKVRYYNQNQFGVNGDNYADAHTIYVDASAR